MTKTTLTVDGMMCSMCESHINDTIRRDFKIKKVASSHSKGVTEIISDNPLDVDDILKTLGLYEHRHKLPNQLSGGQQQRVSIGRALMNAPAVVLADEPTGNLDSKNSQEIVELLKLSNKKYNQTLIMITHDENIALQADRIIAIGDGKITRDEVIRK